MSKEITHRTSSYTIIITTFTSLPSSWLPSVKHMRLYGCVEFSLFSQLDPPHSPPFFLWWFNTFVIELWLACYLFSCGLPFSRLQWFVRVCAQFSMWSFFFMSFSSLLPSLSPRDIKYYALTTTTLFPPNIKQYLRIRWKPINPIWL